MLHEKKVDKCNNNSASPIILYLLELNERQKNDQLCEKTDSLCLTSFHELVLNFFIASGIYVVWS